MENATEALKIGFAILVFAVSISMAFFSISQAINTSDMITFSIDETNFYPQYEEDFREDIDIIEIKGLYDKQYVTYPERNRIVGVDAVISNLYRYYNELFCVIIKESNGTDIIGRFDLDVEKGDADKNIPAAPWISSQENIYKRIDLFLKGENGVINGKTVKIGGAGAKSGRIQNPQTSNEYFCIAEKSFKPYINNNSRFKEEFIEINISGDREERDDGSVIIKATGAKKIFIIYTLIEGG